MTSKDVQDQDNTALVSLSLLRDLSRQLVKWKFLGRELGLTEGNLDDIERNNKGDSQEMKYQTLLQWFQGSVQPTVGCLAKALKKVGRTDLAVSIMQDGPVETSEDCYKIVKARASIKDGQVETTLTLHDVKDLLCGELTVQDCYEIAIFLGLRACYIQEIRKSQNSAVALIDKINDGRDNSDSTINALLFALQKRGMIRVANLILHSEGLPSSIKARASSKEDILPACVCGDNSYKELKSHSDESVVSLLCNSCAAEWFPTTESAKEASLVWKNKKFSYKIPRQLDLSELKLEQVKDVNELQCGDHIVFRRAEIYDHHAIFLHKSEKKKGKITVIHWISQTIDIFKRLVGGNENAIRILCEDKTFPTGGVKRVQYKKCDPADVVVARAYEMLNDSSQKYDLAKNNCESLATFCKIGKAFSIQGKALGDVLPFVPKVLAYFQK